MFSIQHLVLLLTFYGMIESKLFRSDYRYHREVDGWLKLHDVPGTWHDARQRCYMEGVPLSQMRVQWMPGEPDNADSNEDCVAYVDGKVADVNCSELLPFVCYKKKTENMSVMPCGTIDRGYEFSARTGSCYKLHKTPQAWAQAFKVCSAEGGYLAIINSSDEASALKNIYSRRYPNASRSDVTYIGLISWSKDLVWRTVHGQVLEEVGYADWEKGQPDTADPGEHCGAMSPNAKLADLWCGRFAKFLCEKDPDSLQD
ncbi:hemolymph lipopolysaccharide-binding protein-like isoform X3 [Maniola hyperantus]|uniref:hemolymph lipopolysaccharide-binding protein-like isoform X3 n=1 Tax=Aphantopus hyperantus TaxID=2795564 RepID=UPI0037478EF7